MRYLRVLTVLATLALAAVSPAAAVDYRGVSLDFDQGSLATTYLWNVPGLVTVDLRYQSSDHFVLELRSVPRQAFGGGWSVMTGLLRDINGDDPYAGTLRWAELDFADTWGSVSSDACVGTCRLIIPRATNGQVFVLAGLRLRFRDADHRVREIAVVPNVVSGYVEVTFADNSFNRPFTAEIAWAYLPASAVEFQGSAYQSGNSPGSVFFDAGSGPSVLQGFRIGFDDGDHNLRRFTIDLNDGVRMRLQDVNGDDLIHYAIDYVKLVD